MLEMEGCAQINVAYGWFSCCVLCFLLRLPPKNGLFIQYLRAGKVPGAKTIEDVRRAYEAKVPMKRGCTACDVMKAVYYLIEQKYETGQAVPVTGGQVMLH